MPNSSPTVANFALSLARGATTALLVALMLAPVAHAQEEYPAPAYDWAPPPSGMLARSLDVAYRYWWARGVAPACPVVVRLAHLDPDVAGMATLGGRDVWFDAHEFAVANRKRHDRWVQQTHRRWFCGLVVHELGHTAGLADDDPANLMDGAYALPRECRIAFPVPKGS